LVLQLGGFLHLKQHLDAPVLLVCAPENVTNKSFTFPSRPLLLNNF
jgi:hypothetical protein